MSRSGRRETLTVSASSSHISLNVTKRNPTRAASTATTAATIHGAGERRVAVVSPPPGLATRAGASASTFIGRTLTARASEETRDRDAGSVAYPPLDRARADASRYSASANYSRSGNGLGAAMDSVSTSGSDASTRRGYVTEILLISFVGLLLEVSYTRIISFKLFYYYTYLVIGLALLGIGTGGVLVAISAHRRRAKTDTIMLWALLVGAVSVGVGYAVIARTPTDTFAIWDYGTLTSVGNLARLLVIAFALFASFIAIGVMIATLFSH